MNVHTPPPRLLVYWNLSHPLGPLFGPLVYLLVKISVSVTESFAYMDHPFIRFSKISPPSPLTLVPTVVFLGSSPILHMDNDGKLQHGVHRSKMAHRRSSIRPMTKNYNVGNIEANGRPDCRKETFGVSLDMST